MIKRIKFTRPFKSSRWFMYDSMISICAGSLSKWVGGTDRAKTISLCFSDRPHPKAYAYGYSFSVDHCLRIYTETEGICEPFLSDVDEFFFHEAKLGEIPKKGWGWVEVAA